VQNQTSPIPPTKNETLNETKPGQN